MKFIISLALSSLLTPIIAQSGGCPNGIRTRPNYLTMSQTDKDKFHNAIKVLNSQQGNNSYSNFSAVHNSVGNGAHGVPAFFVWHRHFVREFEKALQSVDPSVMLPYWDWTRDSQAPERSQIFLNNNMGPNGGGGNGGCIDQGTFSGWKVPGPNSGCVSRYFADGDTIPSWTAPEILDNYLNQNQRYDTLREQIESTGHALVHTGIGGNKGDMCFMYSPNDPIFWVHHGFIDLIWWEWQQRHPNAANDYPTDPDRTQLAIFGDSVSSTFDTKTSNYCYIYPRWTVNAPQVDPKTPPSTISGVPTTAAQYVSASGIGSQQTTATQKTNYQTAITRKTGVPTTITRPPTFTSGSYITTASQPCETTAAPSPGSCPTGIFGIILGCNKPPSPTDITKLLPQITSLPGFLSPKDRQVSSKIRAPSQVPSYYIQMNGINPTIALNNYLQSAVIACKLNLIPNFKPIVSLPPIRINQPSYPASMPSVSVQLPSYPTTLPMLSTQHPSYPVVSPKTSSKPPSRPGNLPTLSLKLPSYPVSMPTHQAQNQAYPVVKNKSNYSQNLEDCD